MENVGRIATIRTIIGRLKSKEEEEGRKECKTRDANE
jgi:uncharacterized membrane protein